MGTVYVAVSDADATSEQVFAVAHVTNILSQEPAADVGSVASSAWF